MGRFAKHKWWLLTVLLTTPLAAVAADVPWKFVAGTPILASRVNDDFKDLSDRVTALETAAAGAKTIAFAKVSGATVNYFGGAVATGATSVVQGNAVEVRFTGPFVNPLLNLGVQVTAEGNPSNFSVANARVIGFGVDMIIVQVWPFLAGPQTPTPNAPFFISLVQKPTP